MKIFLLHQHRYWTEYIDSALEDSDHFSIVKSRDISDSSYKGQKLQPFNPKKHKTILCAGQVDDPTDNNFIICRCHHSPGFAAHALIHAYNNLTVKNRSSDFRLIFFSGHYKHLITTDLLEPNMDYLRYQMLTDNRVSTTDIDLKLYQISVAEKKRVRQQGTGLIAPSWLIATEDLQKLEDIVNVLSKEIKVSVVLHPLTLLLGDPDFLKKVGQIKNVCKIYFNLSEDEMIDLYDENEFIITDGSGSCYEAILRGCKPLLMNTLPYLKDNLEFHSTLEADYLPFENFAELPHYKGFDSQSFTKKMFPFLSRYSYDEAKNILKEEILNLV